MKRYFETERLILRPFELVDAQAIFDAWQKEEEVYRYLEEKPFFDVFQSKAHIIIRKMAVIAGNYANFLIVRKEDKQPIGEVEVTHYKKTKRIELGYCLGTSYWHQHFMKETLQELLSYFFQEEDVTSAYARVMEDNLASRKLLETLGFTVLGRQKGLVVYNLTKEAYLTA